MKVGMRKPSIKKSLKARTTGKAKRAVKKAVIPGYGKKGMGWIKDPKKAAYNKVYSKTTFGVNDVARAVSGSSSIVAKGTSNKNTKMHTAPMQKASTHQKVAFANQTAAKQKLDYNILVKAKPVLFESIIVGIVGIIILLFSKIIGAIVLAFALYLFYDYKHRTATNDYISAQELEDWISILRKYYGASAKINDYVQALDCTKKLLANRYQDLKKYYDMISEGKELTQNNRLSLIECSNAVLDFEKYVTYKLPDVRFLPDSICRKRESAAISYIDTEYKKAVEHALTLKTEKGKMNQVEKFKTTVFENLSTIYPQYEEYMLKKISDNDFLN